MAVTRIFSSEAVPGSTTTKNGKLVGQPVLAAMLKLVAATAALEVKAVWTPFPVYPFRTGNGIVCS
jgi:hypothetical protein